MQKREEINLLSLPKELTAIKMVYLLILIFFLSGCSSSLFNDSIEPRKQFSMREKASFLPRGYAETIDSTSENKDYIERKLEIILPDTLPDSTLYNKEDPVFKPVALDSGILLSSRDMALYIKDREDAKYLRAEINARKKLHREIVIGAMQSEVLYQNTINEANEYNKEIYQKMLDERNRKENWRNFFMFATTFAAGYILNETVSK